MHAYLFPLSASRDESDNGFGDSGALGDDCSVVDKLVGTEFEEE